MIKDIVIQGAVVGILADVVKLTFNFVSYLLGFTDVVFWQLVATRFLEKDEIFKPTAYFVGGVADILTASFLGVVFVYFIYYIGNKYLYLKGIGFGLLVWVGLFGTLLGQTIQQKLPRKHLG